MSNNKPFAYYDALHDKLLWAEGPRYVHAQRTEGMSLKPLYLHRPRPEPEAEPVAWIQPNHLDKAQFMPVICHVGPKQRDDFIPLYTRPEPARKPIDGGEVLKGFEATGFTNTDYRLRCFTEGIRFAEKHHGIGGDDE